jgi:hypothetical protein
MNLKPKNFRRKSHKVRHVSDRTTEQTQSITLRPALGTMNLVSYLWSMNFVFPPDVKCGHT